MKTRRFMFSNPETFAERLNNVLAKDNITLDEIDDAGVCSVSILQRYITNKSMPNASTLQRLASFLKVSCDWLLGLSDVKELPPKWVFVDGDVVCSACGNRGETVFRFCPSCGKQMQNE